MRKIIGLVILFCSLSINAIDRFKIISTRNLDILLSQKDKIIYLFDANIENDIPLSCGLYAAVKQQVGLLIVWCPAPCRSTRDHLVTG